MNTNLNKNKGLIGEKIAAQFLEQQGLSILTKNFHCRYGEIDLVMRDGDTLVFVEVRWRKATALVSAAASIDFRKQEKVRKSAEFYLQQHFVTPPDCRIDAICIDGNQLEWLKNVI